MKKEKVKLGDLVVHIGASRFGYRVRLVADISKWSDSREKIHFTDGRWDWLDQWRTFDGWK